MSGPLCVKCGRENCPDWAEGLPHGTDLKPKTAAGLPTGPGDALIGKNPDGSYTMAGTTTGGRMGGGDVRTTDAQKDADIQQMGGDPAKVQAPDPLGDLFPEHGGSD